MKRLFLFPTLLLFVLLLPGFAASQDATGRDSSATAKKLRRPVVVQRDLMKSHAELASEHARLIGEKAKMRVDAARLLAHQRVEMAPHLYELRTQALAEVGPAVEQAMAQAGPAIEQAMREIQEIDWPEINAAMQETSRKLSRLAPLPNIPPIPPMPPLPAMAPLPSIPPLPNMAPFFDGPLSACINEDFHWGFATSAYAEHLTDDEQVHLQALAALSEREEAALPEIKRLAREHENWAMRASAVALLADSESAESLATLDEVLSKDTDHRVRLAAVRALSHRPEPEAREILKRLLMK